MEILLEPHTIDLIWKVVFSLAALVQGYFLFGIFSRLAFYKPSPATQDKPPVSVIIAARNEYENLENLLPQMMKQDYPEFELIIVNDASWDDSITLLRGYEKEYSNLKVVNIQESDHYQGAKKMAITLGVKAAKFDRLLFTDADCEPRSKNWISSMVSCVRNERDIVLGYSPYKKKNGFLNKLIRFDACQVAMNYMGFALAGVPYMGVGRNLSYSKKSFFEVGGFKKHYSLPSGDDDLFINQIATQNNTVICLREESFMDSEPKTSWKAFWRQKRRHLSTGSRYKWFHKILLIAQPVSLFIFLLAGIFLIASSSWAFVVLGIVIFRFLLQILIFKLSSKWLGQSDLIIFVPVLELIGMLFTTASHLANASSKKVKWKT